MKSLLKILESYASSYRDLVNEKNWSSDASIRKCLRLNKDSDWGFICTAMDIVGDASLAIGNFLRFSLEGPSRYEDVGEKYLRLYGVLNATYIQQQAIYNLYKLNNVPDPKQALSKIKKLRIREIRHKLASHANDYLNPNTEIIESFIPMRITLLGFNCELINNETLEGERVDLKECLKEHLGLMVEFADQIYEKSIKTFHKGNQKKESEHNDRLNDLRIEKDGGIVIKTEGGDSKIIITLMGHEIQQGHSL